MHMTRDYVCHFILSIPPKTAKVETKSTWEKYDTFLISVNFLSRVQVVFIKSFFFLLDRLPYKD